MNTAMTLLHALSNIHPATLLLTFIGGVTIVVNALNPLINKLTPLMDKIAKLVRAAGRLRAAYKPSTPPTPIRKPKSSKRKSPKPGATNVPPSKAA